MSRSPEKATEAISTMKKSTPDKKLDLHFVEADLQSLASVKEAAQKFKAAESRLDIMVNNAGVSRHLYQSTFSSVFRGT